MTVDRSNTLVHQYEWAFLDPTKVKHGLLLGGFGCGKTHAIGLRWLFIIDWRAKNQRHKCRMMIVEPTYQMVRDVLVPELNEFFDSQRIRHRFHKSNHNYSIWLNGIEFVAMLRSADNPASLTGKTLTDVIIDEFDKIKSVQDQRSVWTELVARIRKVDYSTLFAVTTPEGFKLTYELWQEKNATNPAFKLVRARTDDNHFLPADYIANLLQQYDPLLAKQYLEGEFVNIANSPAYYMFRRELHVEPVAIDLNLPIYWGMDFNVNPMTSVGYHIRNIKGVDNIYIFTEYWLQNSNTRAMAGLISQDYPDVATYITPDMTGGSRKTSADMTDLQILKSFGYQIIGQRNITQRARLNIVNNMLSKNRIHIDPSCKHLINDLEKVVTDDYGQILQEKGSDLTHISDAMGYGCVALDAAPKQWRF